MTIERLCERLRNRSKRVTPQNEELPFAALPFLAPGYLLRCFFLFFCPNYWLLSGKNVGTPKQATRPRGPYTEQQLAGLHLHTQAQRHQTVERLRAAITSLTAQHKPISARTAHEECGLEYASIRRNPEALLLYQQHSTFLKQKRKRAKAPHPDTPVPRDPLLAYKKADLTACVRKAEDLPKTREQQHAKLLQDYVQTDIKIAELEAELARHRQYLEGLRLTIQRQEHQQRDTM